MWEQACTSAHACVYLGYNLHVGNVCMHVHLTGTLWSNMFYVIN